jgi:NADH:ubiquinone oxidoreductase subunit
LNSINWKCVGYGRQNSGELADAGKKAEMNQNRMGRRIWKSEFGKANLEKRIWKSDGRERRSVIFLEVIEN